MHRRPVCELLKAYRLSHPNECEVADRFLAFVDAHEDVLHRTCLPGHVTASCWILSSDGENCLLTLHRKLGRWLQLGGHVDGEPEIWRAALREAQEESGMDRFELIPEPLDIDIHEIPGRADEPAHLHHDIRFLLQAAPGQELSISSESLDLRWFALCDVPSMTSEASILRMLRKAQALRG
jgi:8-oxo-dGTP pyrophosphatase MutT (NUDIX family)